MVVVKCCRKYLSAEVINKLAKPAGTRGTPKLSILLKIVVEKDNFKSLLISIKKIKANITAVIRPAVMSPSTPLRRITIK